MERDFKQWLALFRTSIANYQYYTYFDKVFSNVDAIKVELNIMNSLIGSKNIENDFDNLLCKYPSILKCIPILIAKREMDIEAIDEEGSFCYNFKKMNYSVEQYKIFMRKTGIFNLIENRIIGSLVDYVTGIETGLDSNGRKNRGGHLMENLVESYIQKAGFVKGITYFKEMNIGKPTGNDIREGKVTLPLLHALESGRREEVESFLKVINEKDFSSGNIDALIEFAKANGGIEYAELRMKEYHDKAVEVLMQLPESEAREGLLALADYIMERQK